MNRLCRWRAWPALSVLVCGCASVVGSSTQAVSVQALESPGRELKGAVCELSNDKGKWVVTAPGSAVVHRSTADLKVLCSKEGYDPGSASVVSKTRRAMFGNIVLPGGLIGAILDHSRGSAYEYPPSLQVMMGASSRIGDKTADRASTAPSTAAVPPAAAPEGAAKR
jgi:hypothetical protein